MLEELLNYLSSAFVFIPLIILALFILIKTGLKIKKWTYDRKMDGGLKWHKFPPLYPFKLIGRYILIPIFKVLFEILKFIFTAIKNNKFKTIVILICAAIIGSGMYIYTTKPDFFLKYSQTLTRLFIFFSFIALMFVVITQLSQGYESNSDGSEDYMPKTFKMVGQSKSYLYWAIIMGLLIAFLSFIVNLLGSSEIFTLTASSFIMLLAGIGSLFMLYSLGKNIFKKQLKDNPWFNILYHSIFIIPCILIETTEYLYREFKTTPQIVYKALALEILVVFIWYIMPMVSEYLYTYSTSENNKALSFKNQITSIDNGISKMDARMSKIKSNAPYSLSEAQWEQIRINGFWQESEKINLVNFLKDAGFKDDEEGEGKNTEMVKYIMNDGNGREYDMLYSSKEKGNKQIEELNKALKNVSTLENSKFLLKKAVYLNKEHRINPLNEDFHLGYGVDDKTYNYSISFWLFLHNNNPQIASGDNNYKNILNYDERPKIAYNILENALRIYIRKEGGSLVTLYTKRNFKLQKWHNIVINYTGGVLDVFLNAKLVATQSNVIPKMNIPNLLLGENNGVQGGLTNILYFPTFMSRTRIETNYRLLRDNPQKMA